MAMNSVLRAVAGVMVGFVLALALVIAVEGYSEQVYPMPPEAHESMAAMCAHVAAYPHWILGTVVLFWGFAGWVSTWVARRIGGRWAGRALGLILLAALGLNLSMLPYTPWFKLAMPGALLAACLLGSRPGGARPAAVAA